MPVYLDEIPTDETNPHIINFAVFSDTALLAPEHIATFKLKPIHIAFADFEKLFFKKRRTIYTVAKLCFLNELFSKIKPKLSRMLQDMYCVSNKKSILLNKELFDMVLESRINSRVALTHANLVRAIDTTNDTYVRVTLSLGIASISALINIEFIFKVRNIPPHEIFDANDLLNNTLNLFHGATPSTCGCVDPPVCDVIDDAPIIVPCDDYDNEESCYCDEEP